MAETTEGRIRCPHCGKRYRWKPELANKKVQCKECGQKLRLPDEATGQAVALEPPPNASDASTYGVRLPEEDHAGDEQPASDKAAAVDESPAGKRCPSCKASLKPEAVLCVHCGYNLQKGKKIRTQVQQDGDEQNLDTSNMSMMEKIRDLHEQGELPIGKVILVVVMLTAALSLIIWTIFFR